MRNHCILELLYSCGLRVSELTELKCSDLFFEKGLIRVKGKGDKLRWAPIADSTIKLIREYQNIYRHRPAARGFEDVLFLNNRGKSITRVMVYTIVKRAAVLANINKNIKICLYLPWARYLPEVRLQSLVVPSTLGYRCFRKISGWNY